MHQRFVGGPAFLDDHFHEQRRQAEHQAAGKHLQPKPVTAGTAKQPGGECYDRGQARHECDRPVEAAALRDRVQEVTRIDLGQRPPYGRQYQDKSGCSDRLQQVGRDSGRAAEPTGQRRREYADETPEKCRQKSVGTEARDDDRQWPTSRRPSGARRAAPRATSAGRLTMRRAGRVYCRRSGRRRRVRTRRSAARKPTPVSGSALRC